MELNLESTKEICDTTNVIINYVNVPLSVISVIVNVVVIFLWSSEVAFLPTTYMFKAIATFDVLATSSYYVKHLIPDGSFDGFGFNLAHRMLVSSSLCSIYSILLLALVRLVKLLCTIETQEHWLTHRRLRSALVVMVTLLTTGEFAIKDGLYACEHEYSAMLVIFTGVLVMAPIILQQAVMVLVLYKVNKMKRATWPARTSPTKMAASGSPHSDQSSLPSVKISSSAEVRPLVSQSPAGGLFRVAEISECNVASGDCIEEAVNKSTANSSSQASSQRPSIRKDYILVTETMTTLSDSSPHHTCHKTTFQTLQDADDSVKCVPQTSQTLRNAKTVSNVAFRQPDLKDEDTRSVSFKYAQRQFKRKRSMHNSRMLEYTVFFISLSTFIAFPCMAILRIAFTSSKYLPILIALSATAMLLHACSSLFFFLLFTHRFRYLLYIKIEYFRWKICTYFGCKMCYPEVDLATMTSQTHTLRSLSGSRLTLFSPHSWHNVSLQKRNGKALQSPSRSRQTVISSSKSRRTTISSSNKSRNTLLSNHHVGLPGQTDVFSLQSRMSPQTTHSQTTHSQATHSQTTHSQTTQSQSVFSHSVPSHSLRSQSVSHQQSVSANQQPLYPRAPRSRASVAPYSPSPFVKKPQS